MFLPTRSVGWAAKYFMNAPRSRAGTAQQLNRGQKQSTLGPRRMAAAAAGGDAVDRSNASRRRSPLPFSEVQAKKTKKSTLLLPSLVVDSGDEATRTQRSPLGLMACSLLSALQPISSSSSPWEEWGAVCLQAKQGLLTSLKSALPAAGPIAHPATGRGGAPRLRVVPDEEMMSMDQSAAGVEGGSSVDVTSSSPISFSTKELFRFLAVYAIVESEDGMLLAQLMQALSRTWSAASPSCSASPAPPTTQLKLRPQQQGSAGRYLSVLQDGTAAQFLYLFSELKVIDERLLEVAIHVPDGNEEGNAGTQKHQQRANGLLRRELPYYDVPQLLLLGPAMSRFGLQNHAVFRLVVKHFRQLQYGGATHATGSPSSLKDFGIQMSRVRKAFHRLPYNVAEEDLTSEMVPLLEAVANGLPPSLQLNVRYLPLLLEWLDALALSLHRHRGVVQCVSDLLAVNAVRLLSPACQQYQQAEGGISLWPAVHLLFPGTETTSSSSSSRSSSSIQTDVTASSSQELRVCEVLRLAVQRTEAMELPQSLLAIALHQCRIFSRKGLLVDGGEDAEVPSDRIAYYDHVTADLIKVNQAS